jgi:hypothetical protein
MSETQHPAATRDAWELELVGLGFGLLLLVLPHGLEGDGLARFAALGQLLEHGRLSGIPYSYVGPLFSSPFYYLGKLAFNSAWWCARFNTLVLAGGFVATYALFRADAERRILRTFFLVLLAASMFPNHLRGYYAEVFVAVMVTVGIAALSTGRTMLGWSLMVLGVVNTPATVLGLTFVAFRQAVRARQIRHLVPVAAAGALILLESWVRRGTPFLSGYEGNAGFATLLPFSGKPGFSYPFFFGLLSILLSFGKGLLFFAPGLVLPITRRVEGVPDTLRECYWCWLYFLVGLVLVYAKWWAWYGGFFWGPRFFLIASVPASLAIAVNLGQARQLSIQRAIVVFVVLAWSVWVAIDGALFDQSQLEICLQNNYALELLCWYVPEFSVLWHPFVVSTSVSFWQVIIALFCLLACVSLTAPLLRRIITMMGDLLAAGALARALRGWRF